jgi:hypothetical protein
MVALDLEPGVLIAVSWVHPSPIAHAADQPARLQRCAIPIGYLVYYTAGLKQQGLR